MRYYYSTESETLQGPFSLEDLGRILAEGRLTPETPVCAEGTQSWQPLRSLLPAAATPPPLPAFSRRAVQEGDGTGGIIPYKNSCALISYYLGVFGLIPLLGLLLALPAIVLGVLGLRNARRNPVISGTVHAWTGIVLGSLSISYHLVIVVLVIMSSR